jgi:hypothetical protein
MFDQIVTVEALIQFESIGKSPVPGDFSISQSNTTTKDQYKKIKRYVNGFMKYKALRMTAKVGWVTQPLAIPI